MAIEITRLSWDIFWLVHFVSRTFLWLSISSKKGRFNLGCFVAGLFVRVPIEHLLCSSWSIDIPTGAGKIADLFYSVRLENSVPCFKGYDKRQDKNLHKKATEDTFERPLLRTFYCVLWMSAPFYWVRAFSLCALARLQNSTTWKEMTKKEIEWNTIYIHKGQRSTKAFFPLHFELQTEKKKTAALWIFTPPLKQISLHISHVMCRHVIVIYTYMNIYNMQTAKSKKNQL